MLSVQTKGLKLTPKIENYVEKKVQHIERVMPTISAIKVDLKAEKTRHTTDSRVAQITIRDDRGTVIRAEEKGGNVYAAIDLMIDKINKRIRRYRGKKLSMRRHENHQPIPFIPVLEDEIEPEQPPVPQLVKRKQFSLQPMSIDEACDQMELVGHDFFVFFNRESDAVNVLYQREDGNYGLLQPDVLDA
ncbi:MAG: ribosome-associated translation inhibitor RaiA [Chloroflexota bacterium]